MFHARHFDLYFSLGKLSKSAERKFELVKTWIFFKLFKICKHLKYSSDNQLLDYNQEKVIGSFHMIL